MKLDDSEDKVEITDDRYAREEGNDGEGEDIDRSNIGCPEMITTSFRGLPLTVPHFASYSHPAPVVIPDLVVTLPSTIAPAIIGPS